MLIKKIAIREKESNDRMHIVKMHDESIQQNIIARENSSKSTELLKTERKENTVTIINNKIYVTQVNNLIQVIENKYPISNMCFRDIHKLVDRRINNISDTRLIKIFNRNDNAKEISMDILQMCYNSPKSPEIRCIYYYGLIDAFFASYLREDCSREILLVNYDKDLYPEFISVLKKCTKKIIKAVPKYICLNEYSDDPKVKKDISKFEMLQNLYRSITYEQNPKFVKNYSEELLEIEVPSVIIDSVTSTDSIDASLNIVASSGILEAEIILNMESHPQEPKFDLYKEWGLDVDSD